MIGRAAVFHGVEVRYRGREQSATINTDDKIVGIHWASGEVETKAEEMISQASQPSAKIQ